VSSNSTKPEQVFSDPCSDRPLGSSRIDGRSEFDHPVHHPLRTNEAGMILASDQAGAAAMVDQLEQRGFVVDKITYGPFAEARPSMSNAGD
jgi:hypothetical protein